MRRQPFGGWKKSAVGAGFKAGGPNYLLGLGSWEPAPRDIVDEPLDPPVQALLDAVSPALLGAAGRASDDTRTSDDSRASHSAPADPDEATLEAVRRTLASAARSWRTELSLAVDESALDAERNVLRYRPTRVHVRVGEAATLGDLVAGVGVALTAHGAPAAAARRGRVEDHHFDVSTGLDVPPTLARALDAPGIAWRRTSDEEWLSRVAMAPRPRVRLVGMSGSDVARATGGRPDVAVFDHPVTQSGRLELLPFLREQSVSVTAHRFGTPDHLTDAFL